VERAGKRLVFGEKSAKIRVRQIYT